VRVNEDMAREKLGSGYSMEALKKLIWEEVDAINDVLPYYKKIKKLYLREEPFDVTTSKKIKRFVAENHAGTEV